MNGVLILAHGSRVDSTKDTIQNIVNMVKNEINDPIEIAFMEFSKPNIKESIEKLITLGVKNIKAIPYFLFEGIHIKEDIPNEINNILKNYPDVKLVMGKTLGVDKRLADILVDRIKD